MTFNSLNVEVTRDLIPLEPRMGFFVGMTTLKPVEGYTVLMISHYDKHLFCDYPGRLMVIWLIKKASLMGNSLFLGLVDVPR